MTKKESILKYLKSVESASLTDIIKNADVYYYHNAKKYVGEILARLVKNGTVNRIKKGVYEINKTGMKQKSKITECDTNQLSLL